MQFLLDIHKPLYLIDIAVEPQQKYHYPSIIPNSEYEQEVTSPY